MQRMVMFNAVTGRLPRRAQIALLAMTIKECHCEALFQEVAEVLLFAERSFDQAFYGLVLHEADDPLRVLEEARRVTRQRVCLLEWPYQEGTLRPPIEDRLSPERLEK